MQAWEPLKNHEKENHHCKALNKSVVNQCSFKMEELIKVYKIVNNASVEDSNFLLEEILFHIGKNLISH